MTDDISKADKQTVHRDTLLSRAQADYDLANVGRHARNITGSWDGPHRYPFLPETSPWSCEPVGLEPPLPYSVSEPPEPVGTAQEIQASLAQQQLTPTDEARDVADARGEAVVTEDVPPLVTASQPLDESAAPAQTVRASSDAPSSTSRSSLPPPGFEEAEQTIRRMIVRKDGSQ